MPRELAQTLKTTEGRVNRIASLIDEMKGESIVVMNLRSISDFADAFIIATVRSSTHMNAIVGNLLEKMRADGLRPVVTPDQTSARWTLIDYADVVVHLFDEDARAFYNLEGLWGDAETYAWTPATATV